MTEIVSVGLPDGEWVEAWDVTQAIAKALHPDPRLLEGVALITSRRSTRPNIPSFPSFLTATERELLAAVLPLLPRLHGQMSEVEKEAFLQAFRELPADKRPPWEPCLPSEPDAFAWRSELYGAGADHMAWMGKRVRSGEIQAIGRDHGDVSSLTARTPLKREHVITYLHDHAFRVSGQDVPAPAAPATTPDAEAASVRERDGSGDGPAVHAAVPERQHKWNSEFTDRLLERVAKGESRSQIARELKVSRQLISKKLSARTKELSKETAVRASSPFGIHTHKLSP